MLFEIISKKGVACKPLQRNISTIIVLRFVIFKINYWKLRELNNVHGSNFTVKTQFYCKILFRNTE